jgi:hypothetical protein
MRINYNIFLQHYEEKMLNDFVQVFLDDFNVYGQK